MVFLQNVLRLMDHQMKTPQLFGWFHIVSFALTGLITVLLCFRHKEDSPGRVRAVVLGTAGRFVPGIGLLDGQARQGRSGSGAG